MRVKFATTFLFSALSAQLVAQSGADAKIDSSSSTNTALLAGGGIAVTSLLIVSDQTIYDEVQSARSNYDLVRSFGPAATTLGDGFFVTALFAGFAGYGAWQEDLAAYRVGLVGLESFLLSGAITQFVKFSFGRERPFVATRPGGSWRGPSLPGVGNFSFPSGHSTSAFAAAAVFSEFYRTAWVPYVAYSLAGCVGVSRIIEQQHWASDVFVGGVIGYYSARLVIRWNKTGSPFSVVPIAAPNYSGLLFSYRMD